MGTCDLQTLWSPLVSLNCVVHTSSSLWIPYFSHWNSCEGLFQRHTHTDTKRDPHVELEETREMKFSQLLYYWERHTQKRKAANFIFFFIYFDDENSSKSPLWKHTWWSECFEKFPKKKTKSPHFQEANFFFFEIATFWGRKKQVLKSLKFVEDLGKFQAFFFWNAFMKNVLILTPWPPRKTTGWTDT